MKLLNALLATALLVGSANSFAEDAATPLQQLQQQWATNNYQLKGGVQEKAFEKLLETADTTLAAYPDDAEILIWHGIINSTFAGVTGGLSAIKYAKIAKKDFEKALKIDDTALQGSAYTSLGVLYFKVPGWPIGFGDDDKAAELLKKALTINPDGIDSNYFYGEFLRDDGQYQQAKPYYEKALAAAPRAGRETADAGRREEINNALADVNKHMK